MWCIVLHARQVMKTHLEQAATGARSLVAIGEERFKQGASLWLWLGFVSLAVAEHQRVTTDQQ